MSKKTKKNSDTFAERLKSLRKAGGYSQHQFAEFLNVNYRSIQNWEQGVSEPPTLVKNSIIDKMDREGF